MSEPEACANCRFYRPHPNSVPAGHCHRRAPERGYLDCGAWPSVPPEEWCGEWEAKKAAVPPDGQAEQPAGASAQPATGKPGTGRAPGTLPDGASALKLPAGYLSSITSTPIRTASAIEWGSTFRKIGPAASLPSFGSS